jgi:small subunit ribosomal protein S24e
MVDAKDRKENMVLGRVELIFSINHEGKPTPSRSEMLDMVAKQEPGSKRELIVIRDVVTRFGQSHTSAVAHIYSDKDVMDSTEAKYLLERHATADKAVVKESKKESAAEEPTDESEEGSDE